ncbi:MAG: helical backbone metal receptor [Pyrinomonadaceae bacterium]
MISKYNLVLLLVLLVGFLSSCETKERLEDAARSATRVVADDLGQKVTLPARVRKVVSLAPNLTEIVFAVDGGDRLVGVTSFCNYPERATKIAKVGDTLRPNTEAIVALKPDVVLVSTASQLEAFSKVLEQRKIAVVVTNPDSIDGVMKSIELVSKVLGTEEKGRAVEKETREKIDEAKRLMRGKRPKAFVQIDESLFTVGRGSFITDALQKLGMEVLTADIPEAYPRISSERALALDPELIVISESPGNEKPNTAFARSAAVRNGNVIRIDADKLSRPGPRVADALLELAQKYVRKTETGDLD